jgi:SAM-dependent methyltransferase
MDHRDHVNLLKPADLSPGGVWADLGAGSGAFTLALRELVGPGAYIHAVDKDRAALRELEQAHQSRFGDSHNLRLLPADFSHDLELPPLDGVVLANSLHYFKDPKSDVNERAGKIPAARARPRASAARSSDKLSVLQHVREFLKPDGVLLIIEYNVDSGNPWVPYPFSFETWRGLVQRAGFGEPRLLGRVPSRFLREIYSAVAYKRDA